MFFSLPYRQPYLATLVDKAGEHFCRGALIDENWVLTSASCVVNGKLPTVRLGDQADGPSNTTEQM